MSDYIIHYVKPELLILIPVLYLLGNIWKKSGSCHIPRDIGLTGIALSTIYELSVMPPQDGWQSILTVLFAGITQGVLVAGCSNYIYEYIKQSRRNREARKA